MAVWSEWKSPSIPPVNGDWDFFVSNGTFVMKKMVDGAWVDVASWSAGGVGPAGNADTVDGVHAAGLATASHDHTGTYEPAFSKNTAFNKDFAGSGSATTVAKSDHAHSGIAGLTLNNYVVYDTVSLSTGVYVIDLSGHVPSGANAAFIIWHGNLASGVVAIMDYAGTSQYGYCALGNSNSGSCIVPLDASYRFKLNLTGNATVFYLAVTYIG